MTSPLAAALLSELASDSEALAEFALVLAPLLPAPDVDPDAPMNVAEAAEYMRCKPKRIYDLVEQHRLHVERDGTRLIFRRRHLDAYLQPTGGTR